MGPELELKPNSGAAMEVSVVKDGSTHQDQGDKIMPCESNYKDFDVEAPFVGQATVLGKRGNEGVNRAGCTSPNDVQIIENECGDMTEGSSSFGDTISGSENGLILDGDEVESQLHENEFKFDDGYFSPFYSRKKSALWRKFIHQIMWRAKWLELRIKELQSQKQKYDSLHEKKKKYEFEGFTSEGFVATPTPKLMKRKKRKRLEDTTDIASYKLHHSLFSYESKRPFGVCMEEGDLAGDKTSGNNEFETNDIWSSLEFRDGNSSVEDILLKIEAVHSQVWQLKSQIDKVVKEHPVNFSSFNKFPVPCDALNGSIQSLASPPENGKRLLVETLSTASEHIECNMEDLVLPHNAVSSHAKLTPLRELTGNTDQPWVGSLLEDAEDGYLISNAAVKDEPHNFEVKDQLLIQKPHISLEEQKTNCPVAILETVSHTNVSVPVSETVLPATVHVPVSETLLPAKSSVPNATQESDSSTRTAFPWNTRNQGRRKPGSYKWSRKS